MAKRPPVKRVRKKAGGGTVLLWLIMIAVVAGVAAEFFGPFKGWIGPTSEKARLFVARILEDKETVKWDGTKDEDGSQDTGRRTVVRQQEKDLPPVSASVQAAAMAMLPRTGESSPLDFPMLVSPIDAPAPDTKGTRHMVATTNPNPTVEEPEEGHKVLVIEPQDEDDYQKLYKEMYAYALGKTTKPRVGRNYRVEKRDGGDVAGRLMVISPKQAIFKVSPTEDEKVTPQDLSVSGVRTIFPQYYARRVALAKLDEIMEERGAKVAKEDDKEEDPELAAAEKPEIKPETPDQDTVAAVTKTPKIDYTPAEITFRKKTSPLKEYDPSYAKTPKILGKAVKSYGDWLTYQSNRAGGPIATKIYAKEHGDDIVLYMEMSKLFLAQKYSTRSLVCEQLWHMWSRKCREHGRVKSLDEAHIVLLDNKGKVVGGSRVNSPSDVWVKR